MRSARLAAVGAVTATLCLVAAPAMAGSTTATESRSPYDIAIAAPSQDALKAEPQAIPAVVWGAVALARGFTAAKAPQQVGQVLRQGGFINNILGGAAHLRTSEPGASIDVIFD